MLKIGKLKNIPTQLVEAGQTQQMYVVGETLDTDNYDDITSNVNWMTIGLDFGDYLACRYQVRVRTATVGFDNLSIEDQKCASEHFVVAKSDRDKVHTELEQKANWDIFVIFSREQRLKRWDKAKAYMSYVLSPAESLDVALGAEGYSKNYIEYGIESTAIDGVPGIYDWLETDFAAKPYYNETYKNNVLSILQTGTY